MARIARIVVPDCPHHVTQRGNRRQPTFFCDRDYRDYLELLAESCRKAGTAVWGYCLMPNHVHLVMVPDKEDGLRAALGEAHRRYTRRINLRHNWRGHLWQERFHSFPMDEHHLLAAVRYIERNPLAAGLCERAEEWRWSSARAHITGRDDVLVRAAPMLQLVDDWRAYLGQASSEWEISETQRHLRNGRPLGSADFVDTLETRLGRDLQPQQPGPKRRTTGN
jgi:putative transposase